MTQSAPSQHSSRAVLLLGMHRSGTSALARGMQALGIHLGTNFLDTRPDNPTGYWEDRHICELNERLLAAFGLKWTDVSLLDDSRWDDQRVQSLHLEAVEYLRSHFGGYPLWGFKDPRTVRVLPFWESVLHSLAVEVCYLVVIRNPLSVAASLLQRQGMDSVTAHLLWLAYMVPYLANVAGKKFVVADYDLVLDDPANQLKRIAGVLSIPLDDSNRAGIDEFAAAFLDPALRHNVFADDDFDATPKVSPLTREAYLWLRQLATDRIGNNSASFWSAWSRNRRATEALIGAGSVTSKQNVST